MNSAYRLIWNESLDTWVVAPEIASARGKRSSVKRSAATLLLIMAVGSHATLAADLAATALPGGGQVTSGQATISSSGANMAISQSSQRAIINWQNFDIGSQASVNFQQPNTSAVTLNRAGGTTASRIEGQLTANGQVFLINPNGVLFGSGARVNVGALAVSTLNIRDDDFLAGNYIFSGSGGSIDNQGQITAAPSGYVAFIAPSITNSGTISAAQGTVAMGAGERVRLNFAGDRLVSLDVAAETLDTLITNKGAIRAEGGAILLTAAGAEAVTRGVINNTGVLEAGSLTQDGGRIVLAAADDINLGTGSTVAVDGKKGGEITVQAKAGTLLAEGQLTARGAEAKGGSIQLLGNQVGLINAAQVDASGATGGGTVLVGGDYQGANAEVANARATYIASDVTIKANALQQGDGGKVIVWADEIARFYGNISADGAGTGGNGGFVETSGKAVLDASGSVSALGAGGGRAGSWLLDPYDITIQTAGSNTNVTASPNFTSNGNSAIVTTGSIQTALNAGTSVTVATGAGGAQAGNITVANVIAKSAGGNASLTLNATNNIVFNAGANVTSTVGALGLTLNAGGAISTLRGVSLNGGTLTLNAAGAATQSSAITGNTTVVKNGAGTFTLSQNNTYTGATTINAGTLALGAANRIADTSAVTVAAGATFNLANFAETVGSLAGAGNVTLGSATLATGGNNTSTTFSGVASGTGGLTKAGTGTLTLSGANTYTGTTTINAGTLTAAGGSAIADTSQVTLANAATARLNLASSETIGNLSGGGAAGGNVALGANTLTVNEAGATTYSGVISGTGGLTKAGAGTLTLGGINTYTGATSINAGTLALNATGTISASSGVANAGNFSIAAAKTIDSMTGAGTTALGANTLTIGDASNTSSTYTGVISGTGGLVKAGAGTLTLGGANTYSGTTMINAGTLKYGANNAISSGAVVVNDGGTYDLNNFSDTIGALTVNSGATGGSVTTGTGALTLGGNVTSSGGAANATISGNLALGGATRTFTTTNAADGLTVSAAVSGAVGLTKAGAGTLTLSGTNTYSGTTTINAGTLTAAGGSAIADTSQVTLANAATARLNLASSETIGNLSGGGTTGGNVVLGANTLTVNEAGATTYSGVVSGTGGLTKTGAGTLTLSGASTYTGATNINAGTLALGAANRIADTSAVTVAAGATFNLANFAETVGSLAGAGNVALGSATLTAGGDNISTTFSGVASGTGGLTKAGTGTLTLSGANTYTGTTTINAGTLVVANNTALGTVAGGTTVANGATLALQGGITVGAEALNISGTGVGGDGALRNLGGNNTLGGTVTLAANAEIQSDADTLTLSAANSVTGATRNLSVDGTGNTTINGTVTTTSGTLTKNGTGTLTLSGNNTYTGATAVNAGTLAVTANNALGTTVTGTTVASGATLDFRNVAYATTEAVTLNGGALATSTGTSSFAGSVTLGANSNVDVGGTQLTLPGVIGGAGFGITKLGNGTLVLSGNNTYTGATNINAGTLTAAGGNAIPDASQVNLANVAGATLNLGASETIGNLSGGGAAGGNVTLGANTLTVNQTAATTYAGTINGSGGLTKIGTGTLTLAGANTYAGVTDINVGMLVAANAAALGGTGGSTNVGSAARLIIDGVALGAEPVTLNGPGLFGSGAITSNGSASLAGPVTLAGDAVIVPNSGSILTLSGTLNGAFGLTTGGNGTLVLNGAVGGVTPLAFLTTGTSGATGVGASVRTSGNQTYNNPTTLASGVVLQSTAGNLSAPGAVVASAGPVSLRAAGNVVFQNAANDFGTVAINSGANVALRDSNAIDLGASVVGGSLSLVTGGAVTDSGAISVAGATTINAGATNDITLDNANDFAGNVGIGAGRNVRVNDVNNLTLDLSNFGTLTATASGTVALAGTLTASGTDDTIVLSGSRFVNSAGAGALSAPNGRWLVWSSNPNPFGGATPDNRGGLAYDFKQYNATYGVTTPAQASGNGFLYSLAPTITPALTGTVSKVYDATTTAPLAPANFTPTSGVDGDVIAMSGTGAYDNPNVAGSPTKLVTASGIAATATSSVADGSKPVYGYTLTSTTASANIGEITPAPLTVTGGTTNNVYTSAAQTNTFSTSGLLGSDTVTGVSGLGTGTNVGTYADTLSSAVGTGLGNYTIGYVNGSLSITPAALALNAVSDTKIYDATTISGGMATATGLQGSDSVTSLSQSFLSKSVLGTNGSTLAVNNGYVVNDGNGGNNYTVTTNTATGTITPAPLTGNITADNKTYDSTTAATIASRSLTGVFSGDTVSYTGGTAAFADNNAGTAKTVTATGLGLSGTDAGNYTVNTTATTTANITPAALVIAADDASRQLNTPNPQFTASYSGFVGGETPAVLNGLLSFSTPATQASPVGIYPITPYGQSSGNYVITYVDGKLTIQGIPAVTLPPVFPREVVNQQAIGAQYTDPTMSTEVLPGLYYVFDDDSDSKDGTSPASVVRIVGSGIRLPN